MIIEGLFNVVLVIITNLLNFIHIDSVPQDFQTNLDNVLDTIIEYAKPLINLFIPFNFAVTLGLIVIAIEALYLIYSLLMWLIRKIPVVSIE